MRVSVVIPCYNAENYLAQTIGSVLEQTRPVDEIIVVDDGSTDASLDVARRFADRYPSVVSVFSQRSGNASRTRNLGAHVATGEAIMFLDADDVLGPDAVEGLTAALQTAPNGIAICSWFRLELSGGTWVGRPPSCAPRRAGESPLSAWLLGWYHPPCSVLWSRDAFERAGRWDERRSPNDDGDLVMRALADGVRLIEAPTGSSYYRRLPHGETSWSSARLTREGLEARTRTVEKVSAWLEHRGRVSAHRTALAVALTRIAEDADESCPDVARTAHDLARRYASPATRLRRRIERSARRADVVERVAARRDRLRRARTLPPDVTERLGEEVAFGSATADEVLREASGAPRSPVRRVERPLVSVVIPTYNRADLLPRTLDSVVTQTVRDLEVLVVDDGSTDRTEAVVTAYRDERVRYLRQPHNAGVGAARNRGMREARGELIAFLDSDDEWLPNKVALQVERFRQLPEEVGLVYSGVEDHDGAGRVVVHTPKHRGDVYADMLVRNVLHGGGSNAVIRRAAVAAAGFFDEHLPAIEDYDYWVRVARFFQVDFVEEPVLRYHDVRDAVRRSVDAAANRAARAAFYARYEREMRRLGVRHLFLTESARRHLDEEPVDRRGARRLAVHALRVKPAASAPLVLLVRSMVPSWARRSGKRVLRLVGRRPTGGATGLVVLLYTAQPRAVWGGVQAVCARLTARLREQGHTVVAGGPDVATEASPPVALLSLVVPASRRWRVVPRVAASIGSLRAVHRELRRWGPDVVNVHYVEGQAAYFLLLRPLFGYRVVLSTHGSDVLLSQDSRWLPRLLPRADAVTAVSEPVAARIRAYAGVDPRRVHVIPNGVEYEFWAAPAAGGDAAGPGCTLVAVGRLHPVKGHDVLLDAVALAVNRVPALRLVLVGEGPSEQALRRQVAALGLRDVVVFDGHRTPAEVRERLRRCDVFVLPSRSEGMPVALLEAMAAGLPPVATAVGGVADVIVPGSGLIVPPEDHAALAEALIDLLTDQQLKEDMAQGARDRARLFSAVTTAAAYEQLFRGLTRSAPAPPSPSEHEESP